MKSFCVVFIFLLLVSCNSHQNILKWYFNPVITKEEREKFKNENLTNFLPVGNPVIFIRK